MGGEVRDYDSSDEEMAEKRLKLDGDKRKKHKKHKKHKKSSKTERMLKPKKHKKHKKKQKSADETPPHSTSAIEEVSCDRNPGNPVQNPGIVGGLNRKFTEIMEKVNKDKHFIHQVDQANGHTTFKLTKPNVTTDPSSLVEEITKTLNSKAIPSMEIVSSESESEDAAEDVASPDVAVIEDELNLEELMQQKALLQARLGAYLSESEDDSNKTEKAAAKSKNIELHIQAIRRINPTQYTR